MIKKVLLWILGIAVTLIVIGGGVAACSYTKKMDYFYSVRKMKV